MTQVSAVDAYVVPNKLTNFNAVKITVNDAKAELGDISSLDNDAMYNGVAIEVNRPTMEVAKNEQKVFSYPQAEEIVTYDLLNLNPANLPQLPVYTAYEVTEFVTEAEPEKKNNLDSINNVPEPSLTTLEDEKLQPLELSFEGLSFRGGKVDSDKISELVEIKPSIDKKSVLSNLNSTDFDVQAIQMDEIVKTAMLSPENAKGYISNEIFSTLIDIVNKDTSSLTPPTEKQSELRKQIIINEIIKKQAEDSNEDLDKIELPFVLSEKEIQEAITLAPMEQAERNKEYALYTIALLAKVYADDVEKTSGNVVPLTDLAGSSVLVETMKNSSNASLKIAAMDALKYIYRPEYKNEISTLMKMAMTDSNPYVAKNAAMILETLK